MTDQPGEFTFDPCTTRITVFIDGERVMSRAEIEAEQASTSSPSVTGDGVDYSGPHRHAMQHEPDGTYRRVCLVEWPVPEHMHMLDTPPGVRYDQVLRGYLLHCPCGAENVYLDATPNIRAHLLKDTRDWTDVYWHLQERG